MAHKQNYTARMELNRQHRLAAGLLSDRFPEVSGIVIHMTYYQKGINPVLMERTVNIFPTCFAYFNMECMVKDCEGGGFDLSPVIADMVKTHKKVGKGKLVCCGMIDALASDHASIAYEIGIRYNKRSQ
ncbi:MAG: hypothetical protein OHK0032_16330 [Thermodesulfovibrionales bacterium]